MTTVKTFAGGTAAFATHNITLATYRAWLRSWYVPGTCPEGLPEIGNLGKRGADVTVKEGYGSPYRFANELRRMVGNENAEVLGIPCDLRDGAFRGTVYFCWNPPYGDGTGHPWRDAAANMNEIGTLAIYRTGP